MILSTLMQASDQFHITGVSSSDFVHIKYGVWLSHLYSHTNRYIIPHHTISSPSLPLLPTPPSHPHQYPFPPTLTNTPPSHPHQYPSLPPSPIPLPPYPHPPHHTNTWNRRYLTFPVHKFVIIIGIVHVNGISVCLSEEAVEHECLKGKKRGKERGGGGKGLSSHVRSHD